MGLEEVSAQFVGGGLKVIFAVMGGRADDAARLNTPAEFPEAPLSSPTARAKRRVASWRLLTPDEYQ